MRIDLDDLNKMEETARTIEKHITALSPLKRLLYKKKIRDFMEWEFQQFMKNPSPENWANLDAAKFAFQQIDQTIRKLKRCS